MFLRGIRSWHLLGLAILAYSPCQATTLHVSPSGDDDASGSSTAPLRTIARASSLLQPGDTCLLHAGTYRETLRPSRSGTAAAPIVYAAAPGEVVQLSGCDSLGNWSRREDLLWVAIAPNTVTQLFQDHHPLPEARFPNTGCDLFHPATIALSMDSSSVTATALSQSAGSWNGATVWAMIGDRWVSQTATVISSSPGALAISGNTYASNTGSGVGYVSGVLAALDTAGEWLQRNDTVFLLPDSGRTPLEARIEGKARTWVIDLSSRNYITIEGLSTFAGAANLNQASHCSLIGLTMRYLSHFVGIANAATSSSWTRHNWTNIGSPGIGIGIFGNNNIVRSCDLAWSAGDGITLYGNANLVENCTIRNVNYSGSDDNGISMSGNGHRVTRNTVDSCGRGCIFLGVGTAAARIDHNHIFGNGQTNWDVGGIYSYGNDSKGTEIDHNWVHESHSGDPQGLGFGIYVDNFCSNLKVHHNVVWNCDRQAMNYSRPAVNILWAHNTVFGAKDVKSSYLHPSALIDSSRGNRLWNNLMTMRYGTSSNFSALDQKANIVLATLPLRDPEEFDFRLTDGASAIDSGRNIDSLSDGETVGKAPDVGAYEYGGPWWKAGAGSPDDSSAAGLGLEYNSRQVPAFRIAGTRLYTSTAGRFSLFNSSGRKLQSLYLAANSSVDLAELAQGLVIVRNGAQRATAMLP